jgi:hypothetical protein
LEHRASNPVSVKNLTTIETSTVVNLLRPYVPVGTKRTRRRRRRYVKVWSIKSNAVLLNVFMKFHVHKFLPCFLFVIMPSEGGLEKYCH